MDEVLEILKRVKDLQESILSCQDDKKAILLQEELVGVLKDIFKNKDMLEKIYKMNIIKNAKQV